MTAPIYDERGEPIELGPRLGRGGEGEAFPVVGAADRVAKILYPLRRTKNKYEKVRAMVARPPAGAYDSIDGYPVLTWPRTLLFTSAAQRNRKTFAGYLMTAIPRRDFVPIFEVTSHARRGTLGGSPVTWDRLVLFGMRLCHVVRTLHKFGYAVGDFNDRNLLVSRRFTPLLMDTDSFQVPKPLGGHFPSIVGDQTYWAPELLDVDLATYTGDRVPGDRFALSVLLFQLFLNGHRPYQSRGARVDALETLAEKTRAGHYAWASPEPGGLEPPAGAPAYESIPASIRRRFDQCFVAGHHKPRKRPTADDWYETLDRVREAGYQTCPKEARHVFGLDVRTCPWCADPNNPFTPAPRAAPRPPTKQTTRRAPPSPAKKVSRPRVAAARAGPKPRTIRATRNAAPPTARTRPRRATPKRPLSDRLVVRALWIMVVAAAFLGPSWALREMPWSVEKISMTTAVTTVTGFGAGVAISWRFARTRRAKAWAGGASFVAAGLAAALLAISGQWQWLDYVTGAASFALGAFTFARLEWRRPQAFRPRPQGLVHTAIGLAPAFLPVAALWVWVML